MGPWEIGAIIGIVLAIIVVICIEIWERKQSREFDARMEQYAAYFQDRIDRQKQRDRDRNS